MAVTRADSADFDALTAGADLSGSIMRLARINSSGEVVLAGSGDSVYGVITEGAVQGRSATVQKGGLAKATAGAAIDTGARVMSNGDGKAVTATGDGNHVFGIARSGAGADGEVVEIEIDRGNVPASA